MKKNIANFVVMSVWMTLLVTNNLFLCLIGAAIFILHIAYFVGERELEEEERSVNAKRKASES